MISKIIVVLVVILALFTLAYSEIVCADLECLVGNPN